MSPVTLFPTFFDLSRDACSSIPLAFRRKICPRTDIEFPLPLVFFPPFKLLSLPSLMMEEDRRALFPLFHTLV